jgi:hypothetical protein
MWMWNPITPFAMESSNMVASFAISRLIPNVAEKSILILVEEKKNPLNIELL